MIVFLGFYYFPDTIPGIVLQPPKKGAFSTKKYCLARIEIHILESMGIPHAFLMAPVRSPSLLCYLNPYYLVPPWLTGLAKTSHIFFKNMTFLLDFRLAICYNIWQERRT